MVSQSGSVGITIMGKTADLTVVQKTIIDTLHKEGKPQKVIAKEVGCSQSAVSKHINRRSCGREKCGRKRCTSSRDDRSLERIVRKRPFKSVGDFHKEWTEAGVSASRATTHRRILDMGFKCRIPLVKPLLNNVRGVLPGLKKNRPGLLLSGPKSSFLMRANFASHLETKDPEYGGRMERHTLQDA